MVIKTDSNAGDGPAGARVLGLSFKENCPDPCNTRVVDVIEVLRCYGIPVGLVYPWIATGSNIGLI